MPDNLFSVKQASEAMSVSRQSIRSYTSTYARFFSTEATPEHGGERKFTRDDLKLIAYISSRTAFRESHDEIVKALERGDLEQFRCELPDAPPIPSESRQDTKQDTRLSLVPMERLQAAQALMMDAQAREKEAKEREQALQDRIEQMQREMGKLEGELEANKALRAELQWKAMQQKPRSFWARLLGGE